MTLITTVDSPTDSVIVRSPRAHLLAALRHNRYPVVPAGLTAAVAALEAVDELDLEVRSRPARGLGPWVQDVAAAALAGDALPEDFQVRAHEAQLEADRQTTASVAVAALRQALEQRLPGVISDSLDDLLRGLRVPLAEVMEELRTTVVALGPLDALDPDAVAGASDEQRLALLDLGELRKRYGVVRMAQTQALEASDQPPPGSSAWTVGHGWPEVFETGVVEFSDVRRYGNPGPNVKPVDRLRGLASRPDVWLPGVDEMREAWDRLHEPRETTSGSAA